MLKKLRAALFWVFLAWLCWASAAADAAPNKPASDTDALQLWKIQKVLASKKYVDLTRSRRAGRGQFSQTERRLWFSSAGVCGRAISRVNEPRMPRRNYSN